MATKLATKTGPNTILSIRGREYTLFQRGGVKGSPWWYRVQVNGKRVAVGTKTTDLGLAKDRAKIGIIDALDGRMNRAEETVVKRKDIPTIGELLDFAKGSHLAVRQATAELYERSVILIVESVKNLSKAQVRKQKIDVLTSELARAYQAQKQGLNRAEVKRLTDGNTTANSHLRFARSIFSRRRLLDYKEAGFVLPECITGFMTVPYLEEESHRYSDDPIPQKTIDAMDNALPELKKQNETLWIIHMMVRLMGMRDSEIEMSQDHWLTIYKEKGVEVMEMRIIKRTNEEMPKRSEGVVAVPEILVPWFKKRLESKKGDKPLFLIPAKTPTIRHNMIYREHNAWLRKFIPKRIKGAHELRKHFGAVWATKTGSLYVAAQMLRVTLVVAEYHYSALLKRPKPLSMADYRM